MTLPTPKALGDAFAARMGDTLTYNEMTAAKRLNAKQLWGPCATHDYCDSNMIMSTAFEDLCGLVYDHLNDAHVSLVNDAWTYARETYFAARRSILPTGGNKTPSETATLFTPLMVEPINGGTTYQITTKEQTGFTVMAETPIDLEQETAKKYAQLFASSSEMFKVLTELEHLIAGFYAIKKLDEGAFLVNLTTKLVSLEKIREVIKTAKDGRGE